jgi:hypothetical protein
MKKILLTISAITLASSYFFGQCKVTLSPDRTKICSDETTSIKALVSSITSVPNFTESFQIFAVKDIKGINMDVINGIKLGLGKGLTFPIPDLIKETTLNIPNIKLKNTVVTSGNLDIKFTTDLNQSLEIIFELPYFKINDKSLIDTIKISGNQTAKAGEKFTSNVSIDLSNAIIDFTAGDPSKFNIISYKIKSSLTLSTTILTGTETGDLEVTLNNLKFAENISYTWFNNTSKLNDVTPNISVKDAGKYIVETTSNCGTARDTIEIFVVEKPSNILTVNGNLTFCEGKEKTILQAATNPKFTYKWSNDSKDASVSIDKSGDYSVTITNDICTTESEVVKVTVNPNPSVKLSLTKKDTTIFKGDVVNLKATGATSYVWNTKSTKDTINIKEAGIYTVTGTNQFGCSSSDSVKLIVKVKSASISDLESIKFQVYPNPAANNVYISLANFTNTTLRMYDLIGNEVFHQVIKDEVTEVSVNQFAKGMYLIKIEDSNSNTIESKRFVVE